ncbi:hypothetical protein [Variovorax sp. HJSM1_2]|uniref:hypothetical protein n=1 Tax=Variovorax sp. HJSM1_2 TaxID=3366263 RepID=UPI003BBA74F7
MADTPSTPTSPSNGARPMVGPAMLIEVSHLQHSNGAARHHAAETQKSTDRDLLRLSAATVLCGLGLLMLALIR